VKLVTSSGKVGHSFVGETEWHQLRALAQMGQFHQHSTRKFFVQNFGTKNYKPVFWV